MSDDLIGASSGASRAALRVVVMGVSGSGKSTIGELLARRLRVPYADADDFHSEHNKAKLAGGVALTDDDRVPWLRAVGGWLAEHEESGGVVTCSALRRNYRDLLREASPDFVLLYCRGSRDLIAERLSHRSHHFMSASLLDSQFDELETPSADEWSVAADIAVPPDRVVDSFLATVGYPPRQR